MRLTRHHVINPGRARAQILDVGFKDATLSSMEIRYSIGELAKAASVPQSTVRYYERAGLLEPAGRTLGNYRYYTHPSLDRLIFIRAAQAGGFTIKDVRKLLELRDCANPCADVERLIEHRLAEVSQRVRDLQRVRKALRISFGRCQETPDSHCEVMAELKVTTQRKRRLRRP